MICLREALVVCRSPFLRKVVEVEDKRRQALGQAGNQEREKRVFPEGGVMDMPAGGLALESCARRPAKVMKQGFALKPVIRPRVTISEPRNDLHGKRGGARIRSA